jgi:site-specific recombinase XerD
MFSMSLYKRGNIWWSRIEKNGQVIQRSTKCTGRSNAVKVESAWRVADALGDAGLPTKSPKMILLGFEPKFFAYLENRVKPSTVAFYKLAWKSLMSFVPLAHAHLTRVDPAMVEQYVQHRLTQNVQPATVNNSLKTLRRAMHLAYEWKLIQRVPKIKLLTGERSREFIISEELLVKIIAKSKPVMKQLLPFLIDTGLRIEEATDLTWDRISLEPKQGADRGWVFVDKGKTKSARRYVPLTARAAAILAERKGKDTSKYVWTLKRSKRLRRNYASRLFNQSIEGMGLPWDCVLHSTRHSFCTRLGESGADAFQIKSLAGHSSILISQRYVHPTPKRIESAIGALEASTISATFEAKKNVSV